MKWLKAAAWAVMVIAGLALPVTFVVEGQYRSKASMHQLVKASAEAGLFGDPYEELGTPQVFVIEDPSAVLAEKTDDGVPLLSKDKLDEKGLYPLQMQMVSWIAGLARMGLGAMIGAGVLALVLAMWIERRRAAQSSSANQPS